MVIIMMITIMRLLMMGITDEDVHNNYEDVHDYYEDVHDNYS